MLAGDLYLAGDPELAEERRRATRLMEEFNRSVGDPGQERHRIQAELLGAIGEDAEIRPPLYCDYGYQIRVGARTFINFGLVALDVATITIGETSRWVRTCSF